MIHGKVVSGRGIGRTFGYPTANLDTPINEVHLSTGIYASYVYYERKKYHAALIVKREQKAIEAHLLQYSGPDFYGAVLEVEPIQKVSELEALPPEELLKKIEADIELVKRLLNQVDTQV